jgi:type III restriction enzyme
LKDRRGISLNTLYRVRAPLERALRDKIEQYRQKAYAAGFQMCLFSPEAAVETSSQYAFSFDPENYPATLHYNGGFQFPKHYYQGMVGEFDSKEELECAKSIEMCPRITRWVRNVRGMFSLPTSSGKFYPDFVAELDDGRFLVVEYKGEHLIQYDQEKKNVGELWESKSGGKAIFLWVIKKDASGRDVPRQLADKLGVRP